MKNTCTPGDDGSTSSSAGNVDKDLDKHRCASCDTMQQARKQPASSCIKRESTGTQTLEILSKKWMNRCITIARLEVIYHTEQLHTCTLLCFAETEGQRGKARRYHRKTLTGDTLITSIGWRAGNSTNSHGSYTEMYGKLGRRRHEGT